LDQLFGPSIPPLPLGLDGDEMMVDLPAGLF
jgi:hypothetical protein